MTMCKVKLIECIKKMRIGENMDKNENLNVPYIVYESEMSRAERHIKRLWIALIIAVISIVLCNVSWLLYINQYDFEDYEYTQDGMGVNIIGNSNGVDYYEPEVDSKEKNQKE